MLGVFAISGRRAIRVGARELHWHRPGTVWAMDFTKARRAIDGTHGYLLAVRELASGLRRGVAAAALAGCGSSGGGTAHAVHDPRCAVVLKSDNGSPFFAALTKGGFFATWQVWPRYSPPGMPRYNGSIEASIGSLKNWTDYMAYLAGHAGDWKMADCEHELDEANRVARPRGRHGLTPEQAWAERRPVTLSEQKPLAWVRRCEKLP